MSILTNLSGVIFEVQANADNFARFNWCQKLNIGQIETVASFLNAIKKRAFKLVDLLTFYNSVVNVTIATEAS